MTLNSKILTFLLVAANCGLTACNPQPIPPEPPKVPLPEVKQALKQQSKAEKSLHLVITQDYSKSTRQNGIPKLTATHIQRAVNAVYTRGGQLAVGQICTSSNQPLVRLKVTPPPRLRVDMFQNLPAPSHYKKILQQRGVNSFKINQILGNYRPRYLKEKSADGATLAQYHQQYQSWRTQTNTRVQQFQKTVKPLVHKGLTCTQSDIYSSLHQAQLFLNEPPKDSQKQALFITDGSHSTGNKSIKSIKWVSNNSQVVLVGASLTPGVFKSIPHKRFESISSALDFILENHE